MSLLNNIRQELRFLLEHKLSLVKPADAFTISKGLFRKYLPKDPVIIDCGSHIGADALELIKVFPNADIHCFEPVPELFTQLKTNTDKYKNIHCYPIALGDVDGKAEMFVSSMGSDGSSSLLKPASHLTDHPNVLFEKCIEVEVKKLDTWAGENNIKKIDLLWLDMQGFEFQMLRASSNLFPIVKVIHTEISTKETYEGVLIYPAYQKWLEDQGFQAIIEAIPKGTDMGNVLFLKNHGSSGS